MPRRARSRRSWRAWLSRCRRAWWLRAAAGSSPPSAPGGQSWPAGPVGGRGSHATAPLPAAPPCGMRSHQRAPPGEETHNLNPGPHEQGAPAQPPSFKVLHHLTAPNTTKLPPHGEPAGAHAGSAGLAQPRAPGSSRAKCRVGRTAQQTPSASAPEDTPVSAASARRPALPACRGDLGEASGDGGPFTATRERSLRNNECPALSCLGSRVEALGM